MPQLPENPNFSHLKKQAKDLLRLYFVQGWKSAQKVVVEQSDESLIRRACCACLRNVKNIVADDESVPGTLCFNC